MGNDEVKLKHYTAVVKVRDGWKEGTVIGETWASSKNQAGLQLLRTIPHATGVRELKEVQ